MKQSFYSINKTSFLKFDQCPKAFYLHKNFPQLKDPLSKEKQLTFKRGHEVGKLAQHLFKDGIDVSAETKNLEEAFTLTQQLVKKKQTVIYEATFVYNRTLVMVDILHYNQKCWDAYEVKSSLKISEVYIKDACLQYYVLQNSLADFNDFYLVNLNSDYELKEELNVSELFKKRSIKKDAEKNGIFFESKIKAALLILEQNKIPDFPIGKQCFSPYNCDFLGTCWKNTSHQKSIFNIGKIDKVELFSWYNNGIDTVDKISNDIDLHKNTQIQIESLKSNKQYFDQVKIKKFISEINLNHCFLDMEVWQPAVPKYKNTKPFEQIPFLFSICYNEKEEIVFDTYLKPIESDFREDFLKQILEKTEKFKHVLVYDKNLEVNILNKLKNLFPEQVNKTEQLIFKLKDLSDVIQNFYYFHPALKGNFSLKAIAEIVSPNDNYNKASISSGLIAMNVYESLLNEANPIIKETIYDQLKDYCNLDTLISLKFFNLLKQLIKD